MSTHLEELPPPAADDICDNVITDPPPPYPDPTRPRRTRAHRRPTQGRSPRIHTTLSSVESHSDVEGLVTRSMRLSPSSDGPPTEEDEEDEEERRAFISRRGMLRTPHQQQQQQQQMRIGRPRSSSQLSSLSAAPSLAHTVLSLFHVDAEEEEEEEEGGVYLPDEGFSEHHYVTRLEQEHDDRASVHSTTVYTFNPFSWSSWKRYFRPMGRGLYWRGLVHLLCVNFPFAVIAWVYCFVFTLVGTTTLVALPLGAFLCFLDLLGARAFARAELALQTTFHSPLYYPSPHPPRPIFTRYRPLTAQEVESGRMGSGPDGLVRERSFYKNAYSMFTDPTSYQALFYFIVIKPAITLGLLLFTLIFVLPCLALIVPAPAALRAVRKLGKWQGNVAVEGLHYAVR